jgi:hypothetical protein
MRYIKIVLFFVIMSIFLVTGCSSLPSAQWGKFLQLGKEGKLFYTPEVTKEEAVKLRDYFASLQVFQDGKQVIQLTKKDGVYQIRSVTEKKILEEEVSPDDMGPVEAAGLLAEDISEEVFNGAKAEWHLCDDDLKTLAVGTY